MSITFSYKLIFILLVLCASNVFCGETKESLVNDDQTDLTDSDSSELDFAEIANIYDSPSKKHTRDLNAINQLQLIDMILGEIKRKHLAIVNKRNSLRSMKDNRNRPGWELAYGKRKRSV